MSKPAILAKYVISQVQVMKKIVLMSFAGLSLLSTGIAHAVTPTASNSEFPTHWQMISVDSSANVTVHQAFSFNDTPSAQNTPAFSRAITDGTSAWVFNYFNVSSPSQGQYSSLGFHSCDGSQGEKATWKSLADYMLCVNSGPNSNPNMPPPICPNGDNSVTITDIAKVSFYPMASGSSASMSGILEVKGKATVNPFAGEVNITQLFTVQPSGITPTSYFDYGAGSGGYLPSINSIEQVACGKIFCVVVQNIKNGGGVNLSAIKLGSLDQSSPINRDVVKDKIGSSGFGDMSFGLFYDQGSGGFYLLSGTNDNGTWTLQLYNLAVNTSSSQPTNHTVGPNTGVNTLVPSFKPISITLPSDISNAQDYIYMYGQSAQSQYGTAKIFIVTNSDADGKPVGKSLYTNSYSSSAGAYTWPSLNLSATQNFPNDGYTVIRNKQLVYANVVPGSSTLGYFYAPPVGTTKEATIMPIQMKAGFSKVNVSSDKLSIFGVMPTSQSDDTYLYVYNGMPPSLWGTPIDGNFTNIQPLANSGDATMLLWGGAESILLSDSTPKLIGKATNLSIIPSVISSTDGGPLDVLNGGIILFGGTLPTPSSTE